MKMPTPIANRFSKLVITVAAITLFGMMIAVITKDYALLFLSAGVAIAGSVKIIDYYCVVKEKKYECLEGMLVAQQTGFTLRKHIIVIMQEDGSQEQRILEGKFQLKIGENYRFYIKREPVVESQLDLPEILKPAQVVLGYEKITFS